MSTLKLENIKHENSSTNNMVMNSDGSVSVTGDLAVDTNTLKVDATNNHVGFGTATPQAPIDATLAAGGDFVARFQNTTSATPYNVQIYDAPSAQNGYPLLQVTNSAGSTAYLRVDSGVGRVTMPLQPSFMIRGSAGNKTIASGASVASGMYNPTVLHNVGNHLNTSNAVFTAPVNGRYYMEFVAYTQTSGGLKNQYVAAYLNFSNCGPIYGFHECGPDVCAQISGIFNMSANDTVQPYTYGHSSVTQTYIGQHSYFSGHLLG